MSYILDALRRSEQERRRLRDPAGLTSPEVLQKPRRWLPWAVILLLGINMAALGWLLLRDTPDPTPQEAVVTPVPAARPAPALAELAGRPESLRSTTETLPAKSATEPADSAATANEPDVPPLLSSLSDSFQRSLPAMDINVHVYAERPSSRFVLIGGRSHREGQLIADGLRLERITPDGLILSYQGQRFRILR